jgi:importin subunit beta-1
MQVVCEATQNPSVGVQVGAFECLVRIMSLYYDKMSLYMEQALFGVGFDFFCPVDVVLTVS